MACLFQYHSHYWSNLIVGRFNFLATCSLCFPTLASTLSLLATLDRISGTNIYFACLAEKRERERNRKKEHRQCFVCLSVELNQAQRRSRSTTIREEVRLICGQKLRSNLPLVESGPTCLANSHPSKLRQAIVEYETNLTSKSCIYIYVGVKLAGPILSQTVQFSCVCVHVSWLVDSLARVFLFPPLCFVKMV